MTTTPSQPVTPERIQRYAWAFALPLILKASVTNGIFDALDGTSLTQQELIAKTGASERGITALTEALTGMELLQIENDRYRLADDAATFLVKGKPAYLGGMLQHLTGSVLEKWLALEDVAHSGKPKISVNQENGGAEYFETFVEALFSVNFAAASALGKNLGMDKSSKPVRVLDIAAGSGVWGIGLAQHSSQVHVTAVDFERVLQTTQRCVERFHLTNQFSFVPGDALKAQSGDGYDVVTLGHILHSEGAARSHQLLQRVFQQLKPGGTVAIAEFLVNKDRTGPMNGLIFTINMLVHTDEGTTFSFEELKGWLEAIGFVNVRSVEVPAPSPLVLADKP